ncbi:ribosomal L7Ae/L30e/S12e/Gadd45 family protein [Longirhabdus pacifica]|uniref:ribosomal L7Ae/L30e/S12e/Gadd45 family protein n=1 Tax=Longirhabdus pacifica TaxID=2305227 RepID=UPI0010092186|nr:ribosomal L7Ae/L30e/S12e/Gadd45 family protein [Longirhabdus pacifica]
MSIEKPIQDGEFVVGTKQTLKTIEQGHAKEVYIAADADNKLKKKLQEVCKLNGVQIKQVQTMKELGKTFGIDVGSASAAILK